MSAVVSSEASLLSGLDEETFRAGREWALSYARQRFSNASGPVALIEQPVRWSDMDSFRHVNNARYASFFEAGRITLIDTVKDRLSAEQDKKQSMVIAKLVIDFVAPCQAPDTVLICHRVTSVSDRGFHLEGAMLSYKSRNIVATAHADMRGFSPRLQRAQAFSPEFRAELEKLQGMVSSALPLRSKL